MVYPKNGWLEIGIQSAVSLLAAAIVIMGCASPQSRNNTLTEQVVQTIGDVSISRDGADSLVRLAGLVDPVYSVTTRRDDHLVVVDFVGVGMPDTASRVGEEDQQVFAYDGVVDLVTMSTFEEEGGTPLTRVEIIMANTGRAEFSSTVVGLDIRIVPEGGPTELGANSDAPQDWGSESTLISETPDELTPAFHMSSITTLEPPPAATRLKGISAKSTEGGVLVALQADGGIGALEAFTLESPDRLVIDFPGLTAGSDVRNISVASLVVTGVRIGVHDDRVRVVIDGGAEAAGFQGRRVMPGTTGLWVSIGTGHELEQAMNDALAASEQTWATMAAPVVDVSQHGSTDEVPDVVSVTEPVVEEVVKSKRTEPGAEWAPSEVVAEVAPAPATISIESFKLVEVYGLHHERTEDLDRTAILADDSLTYTTSSPDPTTLVVSLTGAQIGQDASDRIFPKSGGPVSLIHAFQQPEVDVPEVRIVFTRAPNQAPIVSRRGSMLFVDFEDLGVAAAAPPAFPQAGASDEPNPVTSHASATANGFDPYATKMSASASQGSDFDDVPFKETGPLPGFETDPAFLGGPDSFEAIPAAIRNAPLDAPTAPAAVEVPAAIEVLEEGGLIDGKEYRGRRVSLDFKDVAIADVLRLIAEVSDLNIIAGDEVAGNVTIRLVEVPWDQALDVILMTKGLGFVRVGNVLRIAPSEVLKAEEEVRLQERRNKEKLEDLEVKLLPVNYAAVKDTEGLVKRLLSARGTVNLDKRTNTLIIKDISSVIDEASALIAAIDTQTPQVMIEAKIVEASLDFSRELGSVWGIQTNQFVDAFNPDTQRTDLGSEDLTFIDNNSLSFANPITAIPTGLATVGALILDQDFRIDAQIQAAESTGDGKVVSSPRIVTLDNKQASIEQGVSIPFQTFEGGDAKLEFIDAVLSLIVTPHITADESIIMEIEVTRNAPDSTVPTPTGSPAIAKNAAKTETLVKDGQTLVLGGIYTVTKSKTQSRLPYLHRIPVIGNAFKSNSVIDSRKELLVFVTPRIVRLPEMTSK
jgi:type IV pilus secretin PilQ/predicted competence protein